MSAVTSTEVIAVPASTSEPLTFGVRPTAVFVRWSVNVSLTR